MRWSNKNWSPVLARTRHADLAVACPLSRDQGICLQRGRMSGMTQSEYGLQTPGIAVKCNCDWKLRPKRRWVSQGECLLGSEFSIKRFTEARHRDEHHEQH
jgi:hypothetical protein